VTAYATASKLLIDTNELIVKEIERLEQLRTAYWAAEDEADKRLIAGGAQRTSPDFAARVRDLIWTQVDSLKRCQDTIERLRDRALTLREVLYGQED